MDTPRKALRRFREWFIAWFVVQTIVGIAVAARVVEGIRVSPFGYPLRDVSVGFTVAAGLVGSFLVLLVGLLVVESLLELRPWARGVVLAVAWLTVAGAVGGLLLRTGASGLLDTASAITGLSGDTLRMVDLLTKALDVAFWSWAIYTLQVNRNVRAAFADGTVA